MSRLVLSMSLDGFMASPDNDKETGLGVGEERLRDRCEWRPDVGRRMRTLLRTLKHEPKQPSLDSARGSTRRTRHPTKSDSRSTPTTCIPLSLRDSRVRSAGRSAFGTRLIRLRKRENHGPDGAALELGVA
jgi:hypothetical protein